MKRGQGDSTASFKCLSPTCYSLCYSCLLGEAPSYCPCEDRGMEEVVKVCFLGGANCFLSSRVLLSQSLHFFLQPSLALPSVQFSSVQLLSRVRLFATPWIAACQASLSITNSWSSLRLTSIESVMPSSHLILCHPLLLLLPIPPRISLFQWVNSSHEMAKVLEFQL